MASFESAPFKDDDKEVLSRGFDEKTGAEITLLACPEEAIGGDGPIFERLDKKTVYVLISEQFVEAVVDAAPNPQAAAVQYGMLLGDVMRRGVYYAQSVNSKKKKKKNKEEK